ncbi:MAG: FAD-dependent oxidoreductase, partial [Chloroflexi bacterium]
MAMHYPYLIIGGGMAADAAARGIRQVDMEHPIGLIGQESDPPYNRPPLSKGLWKRGPRPMPLSRIWRNTASLGVDLHLGRTVLQLDPTNKQVSDRQGEIYTFDHLLLAIGGTPVRLMQGLENPFFAERVIYFRTLADYHHLRALTENSQRFAVIGGGFIGSEIAAALAGLEKDVTMIFPEDGIGARVLPGQVSQYLNRQFQERGVRVLAGQMVQSLVVDETGVSIIIGIGEPLRVDAVVAGLGIRPNTALAEAAGLAIGDGIRVDEAMRTSHPDIYAAGDVANFYSPILKNRLRAEHEE